ncbi:MAG TPA: hypothetical protein PLR49_13605, partial [Deltaproteobacteria bacterium]|nr:hypothetical protein [Deltaproteobacteria bacterium]
EINSLSGSAIAGIVQRSPSVAGETAGEQSCLLFSFMTFQHRYGAEIMLHVHSNTGNDSVITG